MSELTLQVAKWKIFGLTMAGTVLTVMDLVVLLSGAGNKQDGLLIACGLAAAGFFYAGYSYSGSLVTLGPDAITIKKRFRPIRCILWSDIEEVGLATVPTWSKGRVGYQYFLGLRIAEQKRREMGKECDKNHELYGFSILLANLYGMEMDRFVALVADAKKRGTEKGVVA